jgi:hypothetical protein
LFHYLEVKTERGTRRIKITREPTYNFQLRAFVEAVRGELTNLTDAEGGAANMRVIDSAYRAAGLKVRGT